MITSREYSDIMHEKKSMKERLRSPKSQVERDTLNRNAAKRHAEIISILHQMNRFVNNLLNITSLSSLNRQLLLLLKTTDFLRTIDNKLGSPVNSFEITVTTLNNYFY